MWSRREFLNATATGMAAMTFERYVNSQAVGFSGAKSHQPPGKEKLMEALAEAGKPAEVVTSPDGTTVMLLPYGGRVLGVFSPGSEENFYWTNPALETIDSAKAFFASDDWQNTGGDRTWLAPEVDIFFPEFPNLDKYVQPRRLDPGNYMLVREDEKLRLVNRLEVTLSRSKKEVALQISKSVGPAPNPLRHERGKNLDGVEYAGYTQFTSLELLGDSANEDVEIGLWNLVQMPHGGDLLIPTYSRTEPKLFFGDIPSSDLLVSDQLVRFKMRQKGEHKIGVRAVATTGRVGYLFESGEKWSLIIRNFFVNPSGEYVDVPWKDEKDLGYSTQACNVNSKLGSFSELEYHIPAIGKSTGRIRCDDTAQVWAFRGSRSQVVSISKVLLSPLA
ncbi:MAG: hypothetical protein KC931_20825 [Candidatus Omnitrophica bacterium]|nr:hypothetical protein [Candidatus Omnitrophota bacterium]